MSDNTLIEIFEFAKSRVTYNSETGIFVWKKSFRGGNKGGTEVGSTDAFGYRRTRACGKDIRLHRLAWYIIHGVVPEHIDHINGIRNDNRISNLRAYIDSSCNHQNRAVSKNNTSGYTGVSFEKRTNSWRASIVHKGRNYTKSRFASKEDAADWYAMMKRELHSFSPDVCTRLSTHNDKWANRKNKMASNDN